MYLSLILRVAGCHMSPEHTVDADGQIESLMTEQEAAAILRVTVKTLQGWRYRGGGPPFIKIGRCVRYRRRDLEIFVAAAVRTSTSDPGVTPRDSSPIRVERLLEKTGRLLDPLGPPGLRPP